MFCQIITYFNCKIGGYKVSFLEFDADTMKANLQSYIDQFYDKLENSNTIMEKIEAISWFHQAQSRMEPGFDGNSRTAGLFLNKHLVEHGVYPTLLGWYCE
eukprot:m.60083 g.60083  ORF g.60083 m.60083 type:complete len:101 (-) comp11295_c0_seq2:229-531(-)